MVDWSNEDIELLKTMANEDEPWSDAVQAYLDALDEVGEINL